jgi:hypothetical protein
MSQQRHLDSDARHCQSRPDAGTAGYIIICTSCNTVFGTLYGLGQHRWHPFVRGTKCEHQKVALYAKLYQQLIFLLAADVNGV